MIRLGIDIRSEWICNEASIHIIHYDERKYDIITFELRKLLLDPSPTTRQRVISRLREVDLDLVTMQPAHELSVIFQLAANVFRDRLSTRKRGSAMFSGYGADHRRFASLENSSRLTLRMNDLGNHLTVDVSQATFDSVAADYGGWSRREPRL